jgi:hypothetical protein
VRWIFHPAQTIAPRPLYFRRRKIVQNNEACSSIGSFIIIVHRLRDLHRHFLVARIYQTLTALEPSNVAAIEELFSSRAEFETIALRSSSVFAPYVPCCASN